MAKNSKRRSWSSSDVRTLKTLKRPDVGGPQLDYRFRAIDGGFGYIVPFNSAGNAHCWRRPPLGQHPRRSAPAWSEKASMSSEAALNRSPELRDALTIAADRLHRRRLLKVSAMEHL
jgi:hypothetical protein